MIEYALPRADYIQPIVRTIPSELTTLDPLIPKSGEMISDPFSDAFGGGELSFIDLQEEIDQLGLGETVKVVDIFPSTTFKSDFELVESYIRENFDLISGFRGMVMEKAANQADMCGGHSSSSTSSSVTSSEVNFTSLSSFGKGDEDSEENHKHCGSCGAEYEGANCPNCAH